MELTLYLGKENLFTRIPLNSVRRVTTCLRGALSSASAMEPEPPSPKEPVPAGGRPLVTGHPCAALGEAHSSGGGAGRKDAMEQEGAPFTSGSPGLLSCETLVGVFLNFRRKLVELGKDKGMKSRL